MRVFWSYSATNDLVHLRQYIAEHNPSSANRVARRILDAVTFLKAQPKLGRPGRVPNTRELIVSNTPFIVPYHIEGDVIEILRVYHAARMWPNHF